MTFKIYKHKCKNCGAEFENIKEKATCPGCKSKNTETISSKDIEFNFPCGGSCDGCASSCR